MLRGGYAGQTRTSNKENDNKPRVCGYEWGGGGGKEQASEAKLLTRSRFKILIASLTRPTVFGNTDWSTKVCASFQVSYNMVSFCRFRDICRQCKQKGIVTIPQPQTATPKMTKKALVDQPGHACPLSVIIPRATDCRILFGLGARDA